MKTDKFVTFQAQLLSYYHNDMQTQDQIRRSILDSGDRFNPSLISAYQKTGGTLSNNAIPSMSSDPIKPQSQTTVASSNINENVIPADQQRFKNLSQKGPAGNGDTQLRNGDGSNYSQPTTAKDLRETSGTYEGMDGQKYYNSDSSPVDVVTPEDKQRNDLYDKMMTSLDASTAQMVSGIRQQYDVLRQKQSQINASQEAGLGSILGRTGSERYAPVSSMGQLGAQETAGIQAISALDAQENQALASAYQAQQSGKWEIYSKQLDDVEKIRAEKQALAQKHSEYLQSKQEEIDAKQAQIDKEQGLFEAINGGINPTDYSSLQKATGMTASEINGTLKLIGQDIGVTDTKGLSADVQEFYRLKGEDGGLPVSILHLPTTAEQMFEYIKQKNQANIKPDNNSLFGSSGGSSDDISKIADAIVSGRQPPVVTGLYGKTASVRAELERRGYDYTKANQDFTATTKLLATLNGAQQTRLREAINQVDESIGLTKQLADEWNAGGYPILTKARLKLAKNGVFGADAQSLATRLEAQIADIQSELGTVYKGGNTSTDESLKLAASQLSADWSKKTFDDAIDLARKNIQYRKNSLNLTTGGIPNSQYNPMSSGKLGGSNASDFINQPLPDSNNPTDFWSKAQ